jgi:hypothetical protein
LPKGRLKRLIDAGNGNYPEIHQSPLVNQAQNGLQWHGEQATWKKRKIGSSKPLMNLGKAHEWP